MPYFTRQATAHGKRSAWARGRRRRGGVGAVGDAASAGRGRGLLAAPEDARWVLSRVCAASAPGRRVAPPGPRAPCAPRRAQAARRRKRRRRRRRPMTAAATTACPQTPDASRCSVHPCCINTVSGSIVQGVERPQPLRARPGVDLADVEAAAAAAVEAEDESSEVELGPVEAAAEAAAAAGQGDEGGVLLMEADDRPRAPRPRPHPHPHPHPLRLYKLLNRESARKLDQ
ncbi:Protein of unknown function [Gryllus bimaculatus]|nr:Protein of unknown function [Gryllus bimaculatus]